MKTSISFRKNFFIFILLIAITVISQIIILKPHLEYGFSDVDWGFLSIYKLQNPYTIPQLINNFKIGGTKGGVYTHQIYYIGIQNFFFDLDFRSFQMTTHIFKILAILAAVPIFLSISGSVLVTFISTILFAFSYSAVGTMYTVVTSSDYSAIFVLGIFTLFYWYAVIKNTGNLWILFSILVLFILTLFLSTERMYPLPLFIIFAEASLILYKLNDHKPDKNTIKRLSVILIPLSLIFLIKPSVFLSFFLDHGIEIIKGIAAGNWNLLLTPFIVLGSLIVPHDYTKYLGVAKMDSFFSFLDFFIAGPLIIFVMTTIFSGLVILKRPLKFIIQVLSLTIFSAVILYIAGSHFANHLISIESTTQALVGFYILILAIVIFMHWTKSKDRLIIGLFAGPLSAFFYILLTWIGASVTEIFSGVHRYLTIPAMFMSLSVGNLFALSLIKIWNLPKNRSILKSLIIIPIILLVIFLDISAKQIKTFFTSQLQNGFGAADKQMMRTQLLSYLDNLSSDKPSLIYFDFLQDNANGYYYDNTLLGGFGTWILWHKSINFNENLAPAVFWNNLQLLQTAYTEREGKKGFLYKDQFFELNDFYAFKLNNKKVIDLKSNLLQILSSGNEGF